MTASTLITGATIVNADGRQVADILIRDGIIAAIGEAGSLSGDEVIAADGLHALPVPHVLPRLCCCVSSVWIRLL